MKPKVYLETSVVSYLAARPSRDLVTAAHQQLTHSWWDKRRSEFDLFVSPAVLQECSAGDADAAKRRMEIVNAIPLLDPSTEVTAFAEELIAGVPLPPKAATDALHIAFAVINGLDFLLTWNCTHIANASVRKRIEVFCRTRGFEVPVICTPEELLED